MTSTAQAMGTRFRQLRRDRGLSQYAVAKRAGISREYVRRVEAGIANPTADTLAKLAGAVDMRLADLFLDFGLPALQTLRDRVADVERDSDRLWSSLEKAAAEMPRLVQRSGLSHEERREAEHLLDKALGSVRFIGARADELRGTVLKMEHPASAGSMQEPRDSRRKARNDRARRTA